MIYSGSSLPQGLADARHDPVRLERLLLDNATEILSILSTTSSPADDVDVTHNNHELQNDLLLLLEEPYVCSFLAQPSLISQFWPFLTIGFQCVHQRTHSLVSSIFETFATTSCCSGFHPPAAAASEDVHHRFIRFLLSCLIDSTNLACVEKAGRYLVATLANMSSDSLPIILSGINQDLKGCDDLQRLRIFDFLVNLMCTYPSAMSSILSNEELAFPSLWHALIFSPDDLISMSALTAISSFFSRDSIFEQFYPELLAIICLLPLDDSELSGTCCKPRLPLILSIVASIAPVQSCQLEELLLQSRLVDRILFLYEEGNQGDLKAAQVDIISLLGCLLNNPCILNFVLSRQSCCTHIFKQIYRWNLEAKGHAAASDLLPASVQSLALMLKKQSTKACHLYEDAFFRIMDAKEWLGFLVRNVVDLVNATMTLWCFMDMLHQILLYSWGFDLLEQSNNFWTWLFSRDLPHFNATAWHKKFEIIQEVVHLYPTFCRAKEAVQYLKQGPIFVAPRYTLEIEDLNA